MKNFKTSILIVIIAIIAIATGCKKDTQLNASTPNGSVVNTPNFLTMYWPPLPPATGTWVPEGVVFYDLNHDNNKDKKVIIAKFLNTGIDTMGIIKGPLPIDSIAENWPANVKSGGFGYSSDMVISAYMGMRQNGVNASGKINYRYDSLVHFTNGWGANFSDGMSWLNGKTPQGNATIKIPDGVGSYSANNTIFYFKEGQCKLYYSQNLPMSISSLVAGAGNYDWPNVSNVVSWTNTWGFYTHVFFDFKNWRYFSWEESCASGGCLTIKLTMSSYKSLDKLLKWPAGWGKAN